MFIISGSNVAIILDWFVGNTIFNSRSNNSTDAKTFWAVNTTKKFHLSKFIKTGAQLLPEVTDEFKRLGIDSSRCRKFFPITAAKLNWSSSDNYCAEFKALRMERFRNYRHGGHWNRIAPRPHEIIISAVFHRRRILFGSNGRNCPAQEECLDDINVIIVNFNFAEQTNMNISRKFLSTAMNWRGIQ